MTPQSSNQAVAPITVSKSEAAHLIGLSVRSLEYHIRADRIASHWPSKSNVSGGSKLASVGCGFATG